MADRAYGIVSGTERVYNHEHWRIIKNKGPIGKAFRLQRGYWRDGRHTCSGWEWDKFIFNYEESHDTREQAQAARRDYLRADGRKVS